MSEKEVILKADRNLFNMMVVVVQTVELDMLLTCSHTMVFGNK